MPEYITGQSTYEVKKEEDRILGIVKLGTSCALCDHSYEDNRYKPQRYCLAYWVGRGPYINEKNGRLWYAYPECFLVAKPKCLFYYSKKYPVKFYSWRARFYRWLCLDRLHETVMRRGTNYTYEETHKDT
jgi:hypothetical protein